MQWKIRLEQPTDYHEVERITYEAFKDLELPGRTVCDEHFLAHKMRTNAAFIKALDYVAVAGEKVIGNIMYTKSHIVTVDGTKLDTITFGPLSVQPEFQKQGVGKALLERSISRARMLGYRAVFIFGHPDYYKQFGFVNAQQYGVTTADGENFDAFMALALYDDALDNIEGKFYYDPVYEIDAQELAQFQSLFAS